MSSTNNERLKNAYQDYYAQYQQGKECPKLQTLNDRLQGMVEEYKNANDANDDTKVKELEAEFEQYKIEHAKNDEHIWKLDIGEITIMVNPFQEKEVTLSSLSLFI